MCASHLQQNATKRTSLLCRPPTLPLPPHATIITSPVNEKPKKMQRPLTSMSRVISNAKHAEGRQLCAPLYDKMPINALLPCRPPTLSSPSHAIIITLPHCSVYLLSHDRKTRRPKNHQCPLKSTMQGGAEEAHLTLPLGNSTQYCPFSTTIRKPPP